MTEWKKEICAELPPEAEPVGNNRIIQRKNIELVHHESTEDTDAYDSYECESRIMDVSEYEMLKSIEDIDTADAIDAYTEQLLEEGVI